MLSTCHVVRLGDFGAGADLGGGHSRGDLRYCITKTNSDAGADTILLERAGTINLTGPLPNLSDDVLIAGIGADQVTVRRDTGGDYRIITVDANVDAQLFGLTIANGFVQGSGNSGSGGGILNLGNLSLVGDVTVAQNQASIGGGIYSLGDFSAYFSTIANNQAFGSNCNSGGGIFTAGGTSQIVNSTIIGNTSQLSCFAQPAAAGGITNIGVLTLQASTVTGNSNLASDARGGGVYNRGVLSIIDSTIAGNQALSASQCRAFGGGIFNHQQASMTINNSTISENIVRATTSCSGQTFAGAADGGGIANEGHLTIHQSTIAANRGEYTNTSENQCRSAGGGIFNKTDSASLTVSRSTVSLNQASAGANCTTGSYGAGIAREQSESFISISDSIIAGNSAASKPDISGAFVSGGYNLFGESTGGSGYAATDILNVDPLLGPLQNNGGPTQTMALLPGSPAIDAGDPNPFDPPEWDQRGPGFPRIVNGRIDIGAFEVQATGITESVNPKLAALITAELSDTPMGERSKRRR
jgi:hypothetical protein